MKFWFKMIPWPKMSKIELIFTKLCSHSTASCKYVLQRDPMHHKLRQFCNQGDGTYEEALKIQIGSGKPWQFDVQIRSKVRRKVFGKNVRAVQFDVDIVKNHTTLWWMGMVSVVRVCVITNDIRYLYVFGGNSLFSLALAISFCCCCIVVCCCSLNIFVLFLFV